MRRFLDRQYQNVQVMYNVRVRTRDRSGHIQQQWKGKNIFLDTGRTWLLQLITYDGYPVVPGAAPPSTFHDKRVAFMAVGEGSREQGQQAYANSLYAANPAIYGATIPTFTQDDATTSVTGLEAPLCWGNDGVDNLWQKPISSIGIAGAPPYTWVKYITVFDATDLNNVHIDPTLMVPPASVVYISEAAIYPVDIVGGLVKKPTLSDTLTQAIAYEAFPEIAKTPALQLEIQWTFRL
ncbi:MAG: hypothetical protein GYA36_19575 [Veillonellaceae bacterium]|nr:hypothetical protein [Veillonellaceae bacterium]